MWATRDLGDGLGFGVLSFDETDGSGRLLEVKVTGLGKCFPFYVTANEVRCSEGEPGPYHPFRVFVFGRSPRLYVLHGPQRQLSRFEPVLYRAAVTTRWPRSLVAWLFDRILPGDRLKVIPP